MRLKGGEKSQSKEAVKPVFQSTSMGLKFYALVAQCLCSYSIIVSLANKVMLKKPVIDNVTDS